MNTKNEENELQEIVSGFTNDLIDMYLKLKQLIPEDEYNKLVSKSMFYDLVKDK